ncbi:MAG: hypothetical protein IPK27_16405 [Rhodanobacteraceae bacterium]|nr:hypothetical protein [Rhodanobacteraceae bacterium]
MAGAALIQRQSLSRGVRTLLWLPVQRYPFGALFLSLLLVVGWSVPLISGKPKALFASLAVHAYVLMLGGMLSAMVWVSVCRPETQILPGFRRALGWVWGLAALYLVLLPTALVQAIGLPPLLVAGGLLLLLATAVASGSGIKWAGLVWLTPMLLGIWPEFAEEVWLAVRASALAPLLLGGLAALILRSVWRRLMLISDGAPTLSPADISVTDMSASSEGARIRAAGKFAVWMQGIQHALSSRAFDSTLAALKRGRTGADRRALALVLMPNAHWRGMAFEALLTLLAMGLLLSLLGFQRGGPPPVGLAASYIGMLTALRYQQLHRATLMLRPSLVDVYLASAPRSQLLFSQAVIDALYRSILPSMLFAAMLLLLVGIMYPLEQRLPLLAGGLVGALGASMAGLAVVLMLLDSERPRLILGLFVLGFLGAVPTSLCVSAALKSPAAGAVVGALVLVAAGAFLARARRDALRWPVRFDAPL